MLMYSCMMATKYIVRGKTATQQKEIELTLPFDKRTNRKYLSKAMTQSVSHKNIKQASKICIDHIVQ